MILQISAMNVCGNDAPETISSGSSSAFSPAINLCPAASAQLIECHFESHISLSAHRKTAGRAGSVERGVIVLPNHAHHQS